LEEAAKIDRKSLVDEYAKLREQLKAREREVQTLRMKLAMPGASADGDLVEVGGVRVWTPRFDGLDKKAHASVVDESRKRNKAKPFLLLSCSIGDDDVHVIAGVSPALSGIVKAPDLLKRLDLRGGGRPDFAQGGGVAPNDVDALRGKALELMRGLLQG